MVPVREEGMMNRSNAVTNYSSSMADMDLYDVYLMSYYSTRKRLKKNSKSTSVI
jgi:hypothetical protein